MMNIGDYNRYHEQRPAFGFVPNAVPSSDELRNFHFKYPINSTDNKPSCRKTDDYDTGNIREYAFKGLSDSSQPSSPLAYVSRAIIPAAYAANDYYSKLKVQNLYVKAVQQLPTESQNTDTFSMVSFVADADAYTRTELTISNLESYRDGGHWPSTWQMDWINTRNSATGN